MHFNYLLTWSLLDCKEVRRFETRARGRVACLGGEAGAAKLDVDLSVQRLYQNLVLMVDDRVSM